MIPTLNGVEKLSPTPTTARVTTSIKSNKTDNNYYHHDDSNYNT